MRQASRLVSPVPRRESLAVRYPISVPPGERLGSAVDAATHGSTHTRYLRTKDRALTTGANVRDAGDDCAATMLGGRPPYPPAVPRGVARPTAAAQAASRADRPRW